MFFIEQTINKKTASAGTIPSISFSAVEGSQSLQSLWPLDNFSCYKMQIGSLSSTFVWELIIVNRRSIKCLVCTDASVDECD